MAKDGRKILVSVTSAPIRDASGGIIGISSIARDITRQKQAEEALRQSERDLAACNQLCARVHGHHRGGELKDAISQGSAKVVERLGRVTGYATDIAFFATLSAKPTMISRL